MKTKSLLVRILVVYLANKMNQLRIAKTILPQLNKVNNIDCFF